MSLEVGYMLALGKPVCLAKDRTLRGLHTDLVGKLYKVFDPQDPQGTSPTQLLKWLRDKYMVREPEEKPQQLHDYQCEYFGLHDDIVAFSKEAFDFGAKSQVTRRHEDDTADIKCVYEGVFPSELFDQLAAKFHLRPGLKLEKGV